MWSNAHLSGRWSWNSSHMFSMWQTVPPLGVVVSVIAMFVVKMGVVLFHLSASFYLLLLDVFCKSVIWVTVNIWPFYLFCFFLRVWQNHAGRTLYFWSNSNRLISQRCPLDSQWPVRAAQLSTHLLAQARKGCHLTFLFPFFYRCVLCRFSCPPLTQNS